MNNEELISSCENQFDETQFAAQQSNAQHSQNEEAIVQSVQLAPTWVKVSGGTVVGLLLGASSTFLTSSASIPNKKETGTSDEMSHETNAHSESMSGNEPVLVATSVNDDMSFNETFAAARHEVGAGGAFEWHGNIYGPIMQKSGIV